MSELHVNGEMVEKHHDPSIPRDAVAQFVAQAYGPAAEFEVVLSAAELAEQRRVQLRELIERESGDTHSLLGSTADAAQILLFEVGQLALLLNQAQSLSEVRAAAQPLAELLGPLVQKIADGDLEMPYQVKGVEASLQDIETRAHAVAQLMKSDWEAAQNG